MLRFVPRRAGQRASAPGPADMPGWLWALLQLRGIDTQEKARRFLHPSLDQLHDPFLMQDMDKAVFLLKQAIESRMSIVVYGDYDVDGVCASSLLLLALQDMGATAGYYIPNRHGEGYGLNIQAVEGLAQKYKLLVTVDCGITGAAEVKRAKELGMVVIVTDHHQLGEQVPQADAVLNPLLGKYPFRRLCGAGVALKLVHALGGMEQMLEYLDLAAVATIADLVPLVEENRAIAALGLARLAKTKRPGLKALMEVAGVLAPGRREVRAGQVAFQLAPRINAGGRLKSASLGAELLLTRDENKARELAETLDGENALRQKLEAEIIREAMEKVEADTDFLTERALVVAGEGWNSGVIGLAASRLTERYHMPSVVLSQTGEECVGSARSIPGINIHEMLCACRDLFIRFGGHEQAAGLTIKAEHVAKFRRRLSEEIANRCDPQVFIPVREYDLQVPLFEVTQEMAEAMKALQPTGFGNPEPVLMLSGAQMQDMRPVGREGAHLKCSIYQEGAIRSAIAFGMGPMAQSMPPKVDVLFSPELNEWNGTVSVQCAVKALLLAPGAMGFGPQEQALAAALQEIRGITANKNEIPPAFVTREEESLYLQALQGVHGTVILARAPFTARRIAMAYGEKLQIAERLADKRGFHTLLYPARLAELSDHWHTVILADGELFAGEAAIIAGLCPRASVKVLAGSRELKDFLKPLALSDDQLRSLYKAARQRTGPSLSKLAEAAGLTPVQARAGLWVLEELHLLSWEEEPFSLTMHPSAKRSLEDSMLLWALRKVSA